MLCVYARGTSDLFEILILVILELQGSHGVKGGPGASIPGLMRV